jgi:ubiquinone/menaquinone biosynthesis C-methylase UbiE
MNEHKFPDDFENPTQVPQSSEDRKRWQELNRSWWENNPMRYDQEVGVDRIHAGYCTPEYFAQNDAMYFAETWHFMPWKKIPFEALIPFDKLPHMDVLEIGTGLGSHAMLLAKHAKTFIGIDLTNQAIEATSKRIKQSDIKTAKVMQMDAERMGFLNQSFDFIWTWGVIHHSSDTKQIINEMSRVLRPDGRAVVMVYYRSWWIYYFKLFLIEGIIRGKLKKHGSIHRIAQENIDGSFARYYTEQEWRDLVESNFVVDKIEVAGMKQEVIFLPGRTLKGWGKKFIPDCITRFMTNNCRMGGFLIAHMHKKSS